MTRVTLYANDTAPSESRPLLDRLAETSPGIGRTINLWAAMAGDPMTLAAYVGIREAIATHPTLDPKTRAAVALAAASATDGPYSQRVNVRLAERAGWTSDEVSSIRAGDPIEPRLDALLAVTREAAANDGAVEASTWDRATASWSERELIGSLTFVILTSFVDRFVRLVDLEIDIPPVPEPGREAVATKT
jgi:alkylhydroperoxidase/carboxymuconolactone decarboxylase family protein YurZ